MALTVRPWLLVFGVGVILLALANLTQSYTQNDLYFPTIMTIGAFLVPVTFVAYFYQQEKRYDGGLHASSILPTLGICALLGGLIGTLAAGTLEYTTLTSKSLLDLTWVGPIEEAAKLIVPLIVFFIVRNRFQTEMDGLLFGVATGMTFAALETMGYELITLISSRGSLAALNQTILIRGLLSPAGHAAWTGIVTAALWRERQRSGKSLALIVFGFFLLVAALHSLWDFASSSSNLLIVGPSYTAIGGVSLGLLFWRLRKAKRPKSIKGTE